MTVDGAILFVREGRVGAEYPMTAWTEVLKGRMCVRVENGWPVAQSLNLVIRAARADSPHHEPDIED